MTSAIVKIHWDGDGFAVSIGVMDDGAPTTPAGAEGRLPMTVMRTNGRIHASSWHETHREATDLAERLKALGPWNGMIVITRGGLVPAAIVARVLQIRLIDTICLASYEREVKGPVQTLKPAPVEIGEGEGWLLIDDVADSGATAEEARRQLPKAHYAALYVKPAAQPFVDTYLREVGQEVWIDFPWDRDPHVPDR